MKNVAVSDNFNPISPHRYDFKPQTLFIVCIEMQPLKGDMAIHSQWLDDTFGFAIAVVVAVVSWSLGYIIRICNTEIKCVWGCFKNIWHFGSGPSYALTTCKYVGQVSGKFREDFLILSPTGEKGDGVLELGTGIAEYPKILATLIGP